MVLSVASIGPSPVPASEMGSCLLGADETHRGGRDFAGHDAEVGQFPHLRHFGELAFDDGGDVFVVHMLFLVGERLDLVGDTAGFFLAEFVAHLFSLRMGRYT